MKDYFSSPHVVGILGGGQLGKMIIQETSRLDIGTAVLDPSSVAPCNGLAGIFEIGDLRDYQTVYQFGKLCNVLTIEIEHVNTEALEALEAEGIKVRPSARVLKRIQDKRLQKAFYEDNGIPTSAFFSYANKEELLNGDIEFPSVQKSARLGYDGRGVNILRNPDHLHALPEGPGIIEPFIGDKKEISVIIARRPGGESVCYPPVEMEFHPDANLVEYLRSPSSLSDKDIERAYDIARQVAAMIDLVGIMAVEMFVTADGDVLVNECAPRPHNSGHHTIESHYTSQYEQLVRAILDMPLGSVRPRSAAVMVNLLGEPEHTGYVRYEGVEEVLALEGVYVHIYGKKQTRPFRKMGHVTIVADDLDQARQKARVVKSTLRPVACRNHK